MMSGGSANKHKPKRIDKELLLLRNLPKEYKLGKREIPLGTLLYVSHCYLNLLSLRLTSQLSIVSIWIRASTSSTLTFSLETNSLSNHLSS